MDDKKEMERAELHRAIITSNAGKSGGEYYNTPQEVSELLMRLTVIGKTQVNKVDAGA